MWVTINGKHVFFPDNMKASEVFAYKKNKINGPIDGDMFSAESFSKELKDPSCTPSAGIDYIEKLGDPELTAKVIETEAKLEGAVSTWDKHWLSGTGDDAVFDKERTELHKKIVDDYFEKHTGKHAEVNDGEEPTLTLLGGRGGSGKSNFDGLVYDRDKVIVIDSDEVKKLIPEYKQWNASQVHEESSYLMKKIVEQAKANRMNVVIDQTMSSEKQSKKYLDAFKTDGYRTEAHYMFLPPQVSVQRAMTRFRNDKEIKDSSGKVVRVEKGKYDGRFVPVHILLDMNKNESVFDSIKGSVDNWSFYSNYGVNKGDKPILVSKKVI